MDVYEAIEKRCSVRDYADRAIEDPKLQRVLNAGRLAPSGRNGQHWRFLVVRDAARRAALAEAAEQPFLAQAPVIVAVVDTSGGHVMSCGVPAGPVDCAIAIDHMTLAATAEGLGSCWIGHFTQDACKSILDVPAEHCIIEMLVLGYAAEGAAAGPKKRKPLDEIVTYDAFSQAESPEDKTD